MARVLASAYPMAAGLATVPGRRLSARMPRLFRSWQALVGLGLVLIMTLSAVLAPYLSPFDPARQNHVDRLSPPSLSHPMGTDELGRDVLSRVFFGAQASVAVGIMPAFLALLFGTCFGLMAALSAPWIDNVIMRLMDAIIAFPSLVLALAIVSIFGPGLFNAMLAIGIVNIPYFARLSRGQTLTVRELGYVEAARAVGVGARRLVLRYIIPNISSALIVQLSLTVAAGIITESSLSFLGLGVQPPTPAWGSMLRNGYPYLMVGPWIAVFPGLAISLTVLGFNLLGDGVRDVFDPQLRL